MKKILVVLLVNLVLASLFVSCQPEATGGDTYITNNINIVWKGSFDSAPNNPQTGWAYYDTEKKTSFIWDGDSWEIIAQDGKSIEWKGELSEAPENPEENWAYFNIVDGNSYIYDGTSWNYLAKSGKNGSSGIMLWLGTLETAPDKPDTGYCYYNSTDMCSYIWDGDSWEILAKDGTDGSDGTAGTSIIWKGALSTAPENPELNWGYYDTTTLISYIYDGTDWKVIAQDGADGESGTSIVWKGTLSSAPVNPETNWAYYDTSTQTSYIYNGSSWNILATSLGGDTTIKVSINWLGTYENAPADSAIGDAYYNSTTKASYVYDGTVWQQISKDGQDGEDGSNTNNETGYLITWKGSLTAAPSSPSKGWAYYNSDDGKSYIWDGDSWQIMAQDGKNGSNENSSDSNNNSSSSSNNSSGYSYLYVLCYTNEDNYIHYASQTFTEVDFGTTGLNSSSKTTLFYITLQSSKKSTLKLTGTPAIQISGKDTDCFSVIQPSINEVQSGSYIMDAAIIFTPTSLGEKTATITIPNDSPDYPNFSFTVKGTGAYWPKTFDGGEGDGNDVITCSAEDSEGNLYFVGYGFELVNNHSGFDWWIKKFDKNGVEDTTNWNKKISYYDDYYYSSYPRYDNPEYIVIDGNDNVCIASTYNVVKFSATGTVLWEKTNTSGNIAGIFNNKKTTDTYLQTNTSVENISNTGTANYALTKTGTIAFDYGGNLVIYSGNSYYIYNTSGKLANSCTVSCNEISAIGFDSNNNYYIGCSSDSIIETYSKKDVILRKFNSSCTESSDGWPKKYDWGHCEDETVNSIYFDGTNLIFVGSGNDLINGSTADDTWVKIIKPDGTLVNSFELDISSGKLISTYGNKLYFVQGGYYATINECSRTGTNLKTYGVNTYGRTTVSSPVFLVSNYDGSIYIAGYGSNIVTTKSASDWQILKY